MLIKYSSCFLVICIALTTRAQTVEPDVQDAGKWIAINRNIEAVTDGDKKAIRLNEAPNEGFLILKDARFDNGTIEFDVKGKNVPQQSFVGIAFHMADAKTYDAVYFRPFNFRNEDTPRRSRSIQYVSMPHHPWEKLREKFPGKYEKEVRPVPDGDAWFHVKLVVHGKNVSAYVNDAKEASLQIEKLTNKTSGSIAFWVGNNSGGSFANITITSAAAGAATANTAFSHNGPSADSTDIAKGNNKLHIETSFLSLTNK
jgi:hypothetical protein